MALLGVDKKISLEENRGSVIRLADSFAGCQNRRLKRPSSSSDAEKLQKGNFQPRASSFEMMRCVRLRFRISLLQVIFSLSLSLSRSCFDFFFRSMLPWYTYKLDLPCGETRVNANEMRMDGREEIFFLSFTFSFDEEGENERRSLTF